MTHGVSRITGSTTSIRYLSTCMTSIWSIGKTLNSQCRTRQGTWRRFLHMYPPDLVERKALLDALKDLVV